jgi:MoaA/NifB/PqqE/SkfB family radical SAM enzyme
MQNLGLSNMVRGGCAFLGYLVRGGLLNINLEVTKRCNARCDFCDYWKEKAPAELDSYVHVIRKLNPLSVSITGGEPLLRKDLEEIISSLRQNFGHIFISLITNGSLLTIEKGLRLWKAGLDELSISLDYIDARYDRERKIKGLSAHVMSVAPGLRESGVNLCFNIVIKQGNFREIPAMIRYAVAMGVKVSLSTYNCWKADEEKHMVNKSELAELKQVLADVMALKKRFGNITSRRYYLDRIPEFFENRGIAGCTAGINWIQVTPDGFIKRCSDHPVAFEFHEWKNGAFPPPSCTKCWYACRGAAQESITFSWFLEMARDALSGR